METNTDSLWPIQVSAAIHKSFPNCGIFRRIKVFGCPAAQSFFSAWPTLHSYAEQELSAELTIAATFSEVPTQTAFMSLTARQRDFEAVLHMQTAQLDVLTCRTAPLSPSCIHSGRVPAINAAPSYATSIDSCHPTSSSSTTCQPPTPDMPSAVELPHPSKPPQVSGPPDNSLGIAAIHVYNHQYNVLQLSPGPIAPPIAFDIILPPPAALSDATS